MGKTFSKAYDSAWQQSLITNAGKIQYPESLLQEQTVVDETVSFLREHQSSSPDTPWFLCASFSRPHTPYTAPERYVNEYWPDGVTEPTTGEKLDHLLNNRIEEWMESNYLTSEETMRARAAYFACVSYLDEIIGDLLARLKRDGLLDNTIIVYTSDHGDMIGDHSLWGKRIWYEDSARVPLIVQTPGHRSGDVPTANFSTPVSLEDLYPTICGLANVTAPEELNGVDLSNSIESGNEPERDPVSFEFFEPVLGDQIAYHAVRTDEYKYIGFSDAPDLLFHLESDPNEERDLISEEDSEHEGKIEEFRREFDESVDFETMFEERERAKQMESEFELEIPTGTGNVFHMPDGRLIDADTPLYKPHILSEDAETAFRDFSGDEE
jgi:choline-sulfatase